jgi:hypothetical protein
MRHFQLPKSHRDECTARGENPAHGAAQDAGQTHFDRNAIEGHGPRLAPFVESVESEAQQCGSRAFRLWPYAQALTLAALPELPLVAMAGALEAVGLVPEELPAAPALEVLPALSPYLLSSSAVSGSVVLEFGFCP